MRLVTRPDFDGIVCGALITALEDIHLAQAKNYVVAYGLDIGLLINFGATSLEWKRIFNDKKPGQ